MKYLSRSFYLKAATVVFALSFGALAYAEPPRYELAHAYVLLAHADADYAGHRGNAMKELTEAGKKLGVKLEGDSSEKEKQWKSDQKLEEARRLLKDAREKFEGEDKDKVAERVDRAISEIDAALRVK
jgi:hypothetical protein